MLAKPVVEQVAQTVFPFVKIGTAVELEKRDNHVWKEIIGGVGVLSKAVDTIDGSTSC